MKSNLDIDELLPSHRHEIDRICTRFEEAWQANANPRLEDYWNETSSNHAILLKELLLLDVHYRQRCLDHPSLHEYLSRFPNQSDILKHVWRSSRICNDSGKHRNNGPTAGDLRASQSTDVAHDTQPAKGRSREELLPEIPGYQLIRKLGEGGMARVHLARDGRLNRLVAIKMLSAVDPNDDQMARFRAEARAVATLQHANIVEIHEVGDCDGHPFLALEYIRGGSLAEHLAGNPQSPNDAARFVHTLAQTVQVAHHHGIVHRDLKPANILLQFPDVGDEDSSDLLGATSNTADLFSAIPKITDFGLAKQVGDESSRTQTGVVVGTPSYMAPEQATAQRYVVGPQTDVYALGAILYELLCARPPFKAATAVETIMLVQNAEPVPPRQWQPNLPRDLETICLKCLEKEPSKRYPTAQALAEDLNRFIAGKPIVGRPIRSAERLWRWSKRHPGTAVASLAVLLGLAAVSVLSTYLARANVRLTESNIRERAATRHANEKRSEAELAWKMEEQARRDEAKSRAVAEAVSAYLVKTFQSPHPERAGGTITVAERLDAAVTGLNDQFPNEPDIVAELLHAIGQSYLGLGLNKKAVQTLERGRNLAQQNLGEYHELTLGLMNDLARAYLDAGEFVQSVRLHEQTFKLRRETLGKDHVDTRESMNNLATAYQKAGRMKEAAELLEQTLQWAQSHLGDNDPRTLGTLTNLAWVYQRLGRLNEALPLQEIVLRNVQAKLGHNHPQTLASMNNLALAYYSTGNLAKASELLNRLLESAREKLGPDHPHTLSTLNSLARIHRTERRFDQAISLYQDVVQLRRKKLGEDHPDTLNAKAGIADTYLAADDAKTAVVFYEEVLQSRRRKLGDEHPHTLLSMNGLANTYVKLQRFEDADSLLRRCLEIRLRTMPDNWQTFDTQLQLGHVLAKMNDLDAAEQYLIQGAEGLEQHQNQIPPPLRSRLTQAWQQIVEFYELAGKPDKAEVWRGKIAG